MPFRSGMSASADIQTQIKKQVIAVPLNAVTTRQDEDSAQVNPGSAGKSDDEKVKEFVFVVNDKNDAIQTEVKTGLQDNQFIEILSGLTEKQKVVVAPYSAIARTLKDKLKVKIVTKKELYKEKEE
jgi:HlyD family secretion protein